MLYQNKRTGALIELEAKVTGGDWELINPCPESPCTDEKPEVRKQKKKKTAIKSFAREGES